jgi:ubiquinone/menaquinone biosynthesis C-methylase UbiE
MSAVAQAAGLLKTEEALDLGGEYLDVLGEHDPIGPHRGQQAFRGKFVPKVYERYWRPMVSRLFFGFSGPSAAEERRMALEMMRIREGDQVIDVGCGTGNYTRHLARAAGEGLTVGLDASETMLAAAAARSDRENLAYLRGDACALPFEDETFDVACSVGVIHMVEEPLAALAEMARVLAPGGRLVVLASCARKEKEQGMKRQGLVFFGKDELTGALREHGLQEIEQKVVGHGQFVVAQKPSQGVDNGR